ncbi:MAG: hypothetical protein QOD77_2085 [Thermoplasmata archaeon]|jgi:hypothetical protein|nr:hypothetical protein [Thermoplasmata archaeon]
MRVAAALLLTLLLAGCMGTGPSSTTDATGSATCPRWIPGLSKFVGHQVFDSNFTSVPTDSDTFPVASSALYDEGRPLDRINLDFFAPNGIQARDGRVEMRFHRADDNATLRAYDLSKGEPGRSNAGQEMFSYGPGTHNNFTLQVHLVPAGQPARPTAIRLEWLFVPNVDGNPLTSSRVEVDLVGKFAYRAC